MYYVLTLPNVYFVDKCNYLKMNNYAWEIINKFKKQWKIKNCNGWLNAMQFVI